MTPEAKAREILSIIKKPNAYTEIDVSHIASAIRNARNDALEEAAKVADTMTHKLRATHFTMGEVATEIASSIRSIIKEPTSGGQP